jgi:HEAT repeat protein/phosphohistidine swiveling domain-containing protein
MAVQDFEHMTDEELERILAEFEAKLVQIDKSPETPEPAAEREKQAKAVDAARDAKWAHIAKFKGHRVLEGKPGSPGLVAGVVRNVHGRVPHLMAKIQLGEVVVGDWFEPEDDLFLKNAAALITDSGGRTSRPAMYAWSHGIPAVVGTSEATAVLKDGKRIVVDGTEGAVYADLREKSNFCRDVSSKQLTGYKAAGDTHRLIQAMESAKSPAVRKRAAKTLAEIGNRKVVESLSTVLLDESRPDETRLNAATALGQIATDRAISTLVAALGDWFSVVREKVALVLAEVGEPAVAPVIAALSAANQAVRSEAAWVLGRMKAEKAIVPLVAIAHDKNEDVSLRSSAAKAVFQIGSDNGLGEPLLHILDLALEHENWYWLDDVTGEAVAALANLGNKKAVEPLIKLASQHTEDRAPITAVLALGDIGDRRAVGPLIAILKDERTADCSHLRLATCRSLAKLRDKKAVKPLVEILEQGGGNTYGLEDAAVVALAIIDDDGIEVPLLKHMGKRLAEMMMAVDPELPDKSLVEATATLMKRLVGETSSL